ncbi:hypothetical protein Zm00014a_009941 [Zea mays]|uniref:Uncharacterized protein n=1 Tax=Zea mays TaxID=4577 RepID=A0A3L6EQJ1_MAIZE|nr:hypothetical protein Zm00014a_009941 [Zea mays]
MGPGATRDQQPASSVGVARQSMVCFYSRTKSHLASRVVFHLGVLNADRKSCTEKYRGIAPKKSLVSKDHERAYFDSAD